MQLPDTVKDILARYAARFPLPSCPGCPIEQREQLARQWTYGLVQQVNYELPNDGYGSKRSSSSAPLTKDKIARRWNGRSLSWDIIVAAGSETQSLNVNAESEDWTGTGQVFEEVVGVNLLNTPGGPVDPGTAPPPAGTDLAAVMHRLDGLEAQLAQLLERVNKTADESQARDGVVQRALLDLVRALDPLSQNVGKAAAEAYNAAMRVLDIRNALQDGLEGAGSVRFIPGAVRFRLTAPSLQEPTK